MEEKNVLEHVGPIVATEEPVDSAHAAMADLDRRIRQVEAAIGELRSEQLDIVPAQLRRKTVPAHGGSFLAKGAHEPNEAAPVDEVLRSLSIEQRIAVKSGLLRAGLLR